MQVSNPGFKGEGKRGPGVLRDEDGSPIVDEGLAVVSVEEHERLVHLLKNKRHPASAGRNQRRTHSSLLAKLLLCAVCDVLMGRVTGGNDHRLMLRCRDCGQAISHKLLVAPIEDRLLSERGHLPTYRRIMTIPDDERSSRRLATTDEALRQAAIALTIDGSDVSSLTKQIAELKHRRRQILREADQGPRTRLVRTDRTLEQVWHLCANDEQRRAVLDDQIALLHITRGNRGGRGIDKSRVDLAWSSSRRLLVPTGLSLDMAYVSPKLEPEPWISQEQAAQLADCSLNTIRNNVLSGDIERRWVAHSYPSLSRKSVEQFARTSQTRRFA